MTPSELDAIRTRDAADYPAAEVLRKLAGVAGNRDPEMQATIDMIADRRALLAYVDELLAERAELVSAGYAGILQKRLDALAAENAALKAQLAYAASTGDECAIEVEALRSLLAEIERERDMLQDSLAGSLGTTDKLAARLAEAESRQTCEGTQPYICHALATARSRLADIEAQNRVMWDVANDREAQLAEAERQRDGLIGIIRGVHGTLLDDRIATVVRTPDQPEDAA